MSTTDTEKTKASKDNECMSSPAKVLKWMLPLGGTELITAGKIRETKSEKRGKCKCTLLVIQ